MATGQAVWGIDLGQCALKALRCRLDEDGETLVADAFDYIEYPKILTQPDAEPETLIAEALSQFVSRNKLQGDQVAISIAGQLGLIRPGIKLPPVDSSKIPDIVKYEAKQQIPFPLEEVIWRYQKMAGGMEEEGFALETEVGLFAVKRDQVFKSIRPFDDAGIELDIIQLAPMAIYNAVAYDRMNDQEVEKYDADNPPEWMVVLSMGTDTSDLVITNGYRVSQRNIPIGGNHFTRQLTKELKLTFAKAEHLKRNARQAEDPRTVFQAMRSVFNDLVNEVQRTISHFRNSDRSAKIGKLLVLGNAVKLPGLVQYLGKNLEMEVIESDGFRRLGGVAITGAPTFKENSLAFSVCYGLCVQGLGKGRLSTSLLPDEITINRIIKEKKPWAAAAVGGLLLALAFHFFFVWNKWYSANPKRTDASGSTTFQQAMAEAKSADAMSKDLLQKDKERTDEFERLKGLQSALVGTSENRLLWLELMKAINASLPVDPDQKGDPTKILTKEIKDRRQIHILDIESEYFEDLKTWYTEPVKTQYLEQNKGASTAPAPAADPAQPAEAAPPADPNAPAAGAGPEGAGWVVQIKGYHLYQNDNTLGGVNFLRETILKQLQEGEVELPIPGAPIDPMTGKVPTVTFKMEELGINFPVIIELPLINKSHQIPNPKAVGGGQVQIGPAGMGPMGAKGGAEKPAEPPVFYVPKQDFTIQFCWKETPYSKRMEARQKAAEAAAANAPPATTPPTTPPATTAPVAGGQ